MPNKPRICPLRENFKHKPKILLVMTSLKPSEFDDLPVHFSAAWEMDGLAIIPS